ncbi:MAG: chondroitinase-B domain-containing protein [Bacteroidales bacterium]
MKLITNFIFLISLTAYITILASNSKVSTVSAFNTALTVALPGDTITLANQTWQDAVLNFTGKSGTATAPIVLRAETVGKSVFTGSSVLSIGGNYLVVDGLFFDGAVSPTGNLVQFRTNSSNLSNHCRLTRTSFLNCNPPLNTTQIIWVNMYGTYNRMDHCYFSGKTNSGPVFQLTRDIPDANYCRIDSNYFAGRPNLGLSGVETVKIGSGNNSLFSSNTVVEYNLFEKCDGEIETISNKSCDNIIRYNTFLNNQGTLCIRQGRRIQVYGNFFLGNNTASTGGIRVHGRDHVIYNNYFADLGGKDTRTAISIEDGWAVSDTSSSAAYFPIKNLIVTNNTFVNCAYNINIGIQGDASSVQAPDSVVFANNVVYATAKTVVSPIITQVNAPTHMTWASNYIYGQSLGIPTPVGINTSTNPLMSLQSDGLIRPSANSPLINASSLKYSFLTTDVDGQLRDSQPDIGADEVSSSTKTVRPLTANDVGPGNLDFILGINLVYENQANSIFDLSQNYPNPFIGSTNIKYRIEQATKVQLYVFDLYGHEITKLVDANQLPGTYNVSFDSKKYSINDGVYFCRISVGSTSKSMKIICLNRKK